MRAYVRVGILWSIISVGWTSGCAGEQSNAGSRQQTGAVTLKLRTSDGDYELAGAIAFVHSGTPEFTIMEQLDGPEPSRRVALPVGTYDAALADGWTLLRTRGGLREDVTDLVASSRVSPGSVVITEGATTTVTLSFVLDDGVSVVFGSGEALVGLAVEDEDLSCGGCSPDELCVVHDGSTQCVALCDPDAGIEGGCGTGRACRLFFRAAEDGGAPEPLHLCVGDDPPATPTEDQSTTSPGNLLAAINEGFRYVGQTYTADLAGTLYGVAVSVGGNGGVPLRVAIRRAPGGVPAPDPLTEVILSTDSSSLSEVVTFPVAVVQQPGDEFAIVVDYPSAPPFGAGMSQGGWFGASGQLSGDAYDAGGAVYSRDGVSWLVTNDDTLHFRTFVNVAPSATE